MEALMQAAPKVRKLPPPSFFVNGRKVAWSKVETGTFFARCEVDGVTCTLFARIPDPRVTFREHGTGRVFDETGFDLQACAARAVARMREATGAADANRSATVTLTKADAKAVRDCAKIALKERSRFAFNAVEVRAGKVTATDGKRLHAAKLEAENDGARLIPKAEAAKAEAGEYAYAPRDANDATRFPPCEYLSRVAHDVSFRTDARAFADAMTQAAKIANACSPAVRLYVEAGRVRVEVEEFGETKLRSEFAALTSGTARLAFNPKFLTEAAKFCAKSGAVTVRADSANREPARVEASEDDNGREAYIMPVTVKWGAS